MTKWNKIKGNYIFIGGHRKSGTTLLLALLDGHPDLFVYPYESCFWFAFYPPYAEGEYTIKEKVDRVDDFIFKSLKQIVNKWLRLKEGELLLSYAKMLTKFKRYILKTKGTTKDFFDGIMYSVRETLPDKNYDTHKFCVEKTTSSDIYADEIFRLYPKAKFIHVLRDVRDMYSSLIEGWDEHYSNQYTCKEQLLKSVIDRNYLDLRLATENQNIYGKDKYLIMRYEDILRYTKREMCWIAKFIGVDPKKFILTPSFCGKHWFGNAFKGKKFTKLDISRIGKYRKILNEHEIKVLEYYFGEYMLKFGYTLDYKFGEWDKVLVINGGMFGQRWFEMCKIYNKKTIAYSLPFGKKIIFKQLEQYIKSYKPNVILMQAVETSATQKFNVEAVGKLCKKYNTKFMVDAISTFLLDEYLMDKWNIDVSIISSQKGLGLAPGLSMVIFKSLFYGTQSYYFDLSKYLNLSGDLGLPFTPNILVLKQLNYRLKEVIKLGLNKTIKKAEILAKDFRKKIKDLPFTLIAETPSNCATGLYTKRTDVKKLFKHLLTKNIYFVPSGGEAGKKFIVGHMGNLTVNDNTVLVRELKKWLKRK